MNEAEQISRDRIKAFTEAFLNHEPVEIEGEIHHIVKHEKEPMYRTVKHLFTTDKSLVIEEIALFDFESKPT